MVRKHRVDERMAVLVGAVSGLLASTAGAGPTGARVIDSTVVAISVGVVVWLGATAPWWAVATVAGTAMVSAPSPFWLIVAVGAFVGSLGIGTARRDLPTARAVVVGVSVNVLLRSHLDFFFGASAMITGVVCVAVAVTGLRRRRPRTRRVVIWSIVAIAVFALVAGAGLGAAGLSARNDLAAADALARKAVGLVGAGDYAGAAEQFDLARRSFADADARLSAPWAQPARLVPVVAQHRRAVVDLADRAADASASVSTALGLIDPDQLRLEAGRLDLATLELIHPPFTEVQRSMHDLRTVIADIDSPWLAGAVQRRLDDVAAELEDVMPGVDNAVDAISLAPQILGADGARRYFIAFTTPAETRGLGGFMGNWAELTAVDGRLSLTDSGRTLDLNRGPGVDTHRTVTGPADWLETWGSFGFDNGPDRTTDAEPWSNVTISPNFPATAQVIAELYPQSGGRALDGVFAMDPSVLQALLSLTGPIQVTGSDVLLNATNAVSFLLVDQYEIESDQRVDLLEAVASQTIGQVLDGSLPPPTVVAKELGPLATAGRLVGWMADVDEQALLSAIHMDGAMPTLADGDGVALVLNNAGANKLDVYLERQLTYRATVDRDTGAVSATVEATLTNTAPSSGLPSGVIGNYTGDAPGTNRVLLSLYSALPVAAASAEGGAPIVLEKSEEAGWNVGSSFVVVAPASSVTIVYDLAGTLDVRNGYRLALRPQPIVIDQVDDIEVVSTTGVRLVARTGRAVAPEVLSE